LYNAYPALSAALGAESRVSYPSTSRQANSMSAHILPPLAFNSKSERKVNSLPLLGFEPVILGMLTHLSNHSSKSHPIVTWKAHLQSARFCRSRCGSCWQVGRHCCHPHMVPHSRSHLFNPIQFKSIQFNSIISLWSIPKRTWFIGPLTRNSTSNNSNRFHLTSVHTIAILRNNEKNVTSLTIS
jgi:hypothetical protein